jgi:hypothetical protein
MIQIKMINAHAITNQFHVKTTVRLTDILGRNCKLKSTITPSVHNFPILLNLTPTTLHIVKHIFCTADMLFDSLPTNYCSKLHIFPQHICYYIKFLDLKLNGIIGAAAVKCNQHYYTLIVQGGLSVGYWQDMHTLT